MKNTFRSAIKCYVGNVSFVLQNANRPIPAHPVSNTRLALEPVQVVPGHQFSKTVLYILLDE